MTSQTLAGTLEGFLSGSTGAVVVEDGVVVFNLEHAKYSVSGETSKCLLHLWSEERNIVRRVLDVQDKGETLHVTGQKIGQLRPSRLDIHRARDPRTASAKRAARAAYQRVLERVLRKHFPDWLILQLNTAMDLEKSFGPIYCRGLVKHGVFGLCCPGRESARITGLDRRRADLRNPVAGFLSHCAFWQTGSRRVEVVCTRWKLRSST